MMLAVLSLGAAAALPTRVYAQLSDPLAPLPARAPEILLQGRVRSLDIGQRTLVLDVESFALPSGRTRRIKAPVAKTVIVQEGTLLHVRGDVSRLLQLSDLHEGVFAVVTGTDTGTGQPLPARQIAVWERVEPLFLFGTQPASRSGPSPLFPGGSPSSPGAAVQPISQFGSSGSTLAPISASASGNVLPQGNFEAVENNRPREWEFLTGDAHLHRDQKDNRYVLITSEGGGERKVQTKLRLDPSWKKLRLAARMRVTSLKLSQKPQPWENAHVGLVYQDASGKQLSIGAMPGLDKDSDWTTVSEDSIVPPGAQVAVVDAGLYASSGAAAFDDITLTPITPTIEDNVLPQGDFEATVNGRLSDWVLPPSARWEQDETGNHFASIRVTSDLPNEARKIQTTAIVEPGWKKLRVSSRMRLQNARVGKTNGEDAHLGVVFKDAQGKDLGFVIVGSLQQDTDWASYSGMADVPPTAAQMVVDVGVYGQRGELSIDDIVVTPNPKG